MIYSERKLFTGFTDAAFIVFAAITSSAITNIIANSAIIKPMSTPLLKANILIKKCPMR